MNEYTTERGVTIGWVPIPFLLDQIRASFRASEPPRPTYTETIIDAEGREHSQEREITLQDAEAAREHNPEWWAEHADAWAQYQADLQAWTQRLNDKIWDAVALESLQVDLPEDGAWIDKQERFLDLQVPDDPTARRLHYIRTEIIGGIRDYVKLTALANGSDIEEADLAIAEDSFRYLLQGRLAAGLAQTRRRGAVAVVDESPGSAPADGAGVGEGAE
jgi:hypothetical protein